MENRVVNKGQTPRAVACLCKALAAIALLALSGCASPGGYYGPGAGHFDTVVVDAGHGGSDSGARPRSGSNEEALTLDTARRLAVILRRNGFKVVETRTSDYFIPLGARSEASNRRSSCIFVSVHYNWARRKAAHGIETFYYGIKSKRLAANVQRETLKAYSTIDRGIKERGFYVLRTNRRPAILCELGFVSNAAENQKIQNPATRQRLAERIAAGIIAERNGRQP